MPSKSPTVAFPLLLPIFIASLNPEMDPDHLVQLAIRRSPRATLQNQKAFNHVQYEYDDPYHTATPPIPQRGPLPVEKVKSPSPLRAHPVAADTATRVPNRHSSFSRPFRELLPVTPNPEPEPESDPESEPGPAPVTQYEQIPRRHPSRLRSYKDPRRPMYLRKRTSLETIDSVRSIASVAPSEDQRDPIESEVPSPDLSILEYADDAFRLSIARDASSISSFSIDSRQSSIPSSIPQDPIQHEERSPKALLQRIKLKKSYTHESAVPEPLTIQRKVSVDRTLCPSSSSNSVVNVPLGQTSMTPRDQHFERSQSQSSSEWSASSFDISNLTEAEIKKCQKKGINPSLYAEMKAARKGKWTSPIAGNTFLS